MKQIQWPGRYCYKNVFIKLFSCFIAAKCTLLLSLMQGLFNAPLQEENSLGVTFKRLMLVYLQVVLRIHSICPISPANQSIIL